MDQLKFIVQSVQNSMNPNRPTLFLKRCCDILVKIFFLLKNDGEIINMINAMRSVDTQSMKISLYYLIEVSC